MGWVRVHWQLFAWFYANLNHPEPVIFKHNLDVLEATLRILAQHLAAREQHRAEPVAPLRRLIRFLPLSSLLPLVTNRRFPDVQPSSRTRH
jgi:hypothetical protein